MPAQQLRASLACSFSYLRCPRRLKFGRRSSQILRINFDTQFHEILTYIQTSIIELCYLIHTFHTVTVPLCRQAELNPRICCVSNTYIIFCHFIQTSQHYNTSTQGKDNKAFICHSQAIYYCQKFYKRQKQFSNTIFVLQISSYMIKQSQVKTKKISQIESQALMNHSIFMALSQVEEICNYLSGNRKSKEDKRFGHYDPCEYQHRSFSILKDQLVLSVAAVEQHRKLFSHRHQDGKIQLPENFNEEQVMNQIDEFLQTIHQYHKQKDLSEVEELIVQFKNVMQDKFSTFQYDSYFSEEQNNKVTNNVPKFVKKVVIAQQITESVAEEVRNSQITQSSNLRAKIQEKSQTNVSSQSNKEIDKELQNLNICESSSKVLQEFSFRFKVFVDRKKKLDKKIPCQKCPQSIYQRSIKLLQNYFPQFKPRHVYVKEKRVPRQKKLSFQQLQYYLSKGEIEVIEFWG